MAVHVLTNPQSNFTDPGLPIDDPAVIAQQEIRHDERHNQDAAGVKLDPPRAETQWTVPPINSGSPAASADHSISLEMGVIYEVIPGGDTLFQNVAENEDDKIFFSTHGDPEGTWGKLNPGSMISTSATVFLLNRTSFENVRIAVIEAGA